MLSITALRLARGRHLILDGFSGALAAGKGAWLLGPNGSGKTSLLRAAAGLLNPLGGAIKTTDSKIFIGHPAGHDNILTVRENLEHWCMLHGREDGSEAALIAAGLEKALDKPARALSAGQQQRLALARLLCVDAKLWLLDEPFAALDTAGQTWLVALIRKHLNDGGAALVATHATYEGTGMSNWQVAA